jgi:hypothetical protein
MTALRTNRAVVTSVWCWPEVRERGRCGRHIIGWRRPLVGSRL